MLTITPAAEEALDAVVSSEAAPDGAGVRISQGIGANGQPALGLMLTEAPEPGDEVIEDASVPVYLAPEIAEVLDDKVLDAHLEGDQVAFQLTERA